jgi:hypothetical protein
MDGTSFFLILIFGSIIVLLLTSGDGSLTGFPLFMLIAAAVLILFVGPCVTSW